VRASRAHTTSWSNPERTDAYAIRSRHANERGRGPRCQRHVWESRRGICERLEHPLCRQRGVTPNEQATSRTDLRYDRPAGSLMGMTGGLVRASDDDIGRFRVDRSGLSAFIAGDTWAPPIRRVQPKGILGWLLRLTPITIEEVDPDAVPPEGAKLVEAESHLDLDKAWQPLHFLLTGTAWEGEEPGCYLVRGGEELAEDDELGYSSIRALTPHQVSRFDEFLTNLSHDTLRRRFDYARMVALDIYAKPRRREKAGAHDEVVPLLEAFDALQSFVAVTAKEGAGAIVYLT
jgi:hypothetical protein